MWKISHSKKDHISHSKKDPTTNDHISHSKKDHNPQANTLNDTHI